MRQAFDRLLVATDGQRLYEITEPVRSWVAAQDIARGLLTLYIHHTSASLLIQENADPRVLDDLNAFFRKLVTEDVRHYSHTQEGPDDMPAHIRAALTATQLSIPVVGGRPDLGPWQGIFLYEHRARGRERRITLHLLGE
jgi:secondary thiamine-phosphate synthase enzyme